MSSIVEQQASRGKTSAPPADGETIDALLSGGAGSGSRGNIKIVRCCTKEDAPQCHLFCKGVHIYLPLPLKIVSSTQTSWNTLQSEGGMGKDVMLGIAQNNNLDYVAQTFGRGLGKLWDVKTGAVAALGGSKQWLMAKSGVACLPAKELTFDGIDFRTFSFQWSLVPLNKGDSDNIHEMIKKVQEFMLPAFGEGIVGYPDLWAINWKDGRSNKTEALPIIKDSYVEKIDIDYSAAGQYTHVHEKCEPISFLVSMTFKEATLFTREDVKAKIYG